MSYPILRRPALAALVLTMTLTACGGTGARSWKPWSWFGPRDTGPNTLEPKGGYAAADGREMVAQILTARLEPTNEGRLLVVTALASSQGWWDIALEPVTPQAPGRLRADNDGILRLKIVGTPPAPDGPWAGRPARPGVDTITTALALNNETLTRIDRIEVAAAQNGMTLRR